MAAMQDSFGALPQSGPLPMQESDAGTNLIVNYIPITMSEVCAFLHINFGFSRKSDNPDRRIICEPLS